MSPLKPLPIVERWDCHGCGLCCRDAIVPLDDDDVARLKEQRWDEQPEYRGVKVTVRARIGGARAMLAQKADGACVFLTAAGRCRIHELHGIEAKPKVCRQYPLQVVPVDDRLLVAARRSCPSAAKCEGRPVEQHLAQLREVLPRGLDRLRGKPPEIIAGHARDWADTRLVTDCLNRMMCDTRYPLVPDFPTVEFASLEEPLGKINLELLRPLDEYFQALAVSLRYCTLAYRKWSVVEGFRALAIQFPIALWSWRWACGNQLTAVTLIPIIVCLDRAHTAAPLTSWRHKRRCDVLCVDGQLQRLVAWYAR